MIRSFTVRYRSIADLHTLKHQCGNWPAERMLLQVFCGIQDRDALERLRRELVCCFPGTAIIGTTTAGEVMGARVEEQTVVVNLCRFDRTCARSRLIEQNGDLCGAGRSLAESFAHCTPKVLILFGCGLKQQRTVDVAPLLRALQQHLTQTPIAGGHAGDNGIGRITRVFTEAGISCSGFAAAALIGAELVVGSSYSLAWAPIGRKFTITRAEGGRVYSIDNQSPYALYRHYLGQEVVDGLPLAAADFPLIIERDGVPLAAHALGVNDDGSFDYIYAFHAGEQAQFGFCHAGLVAEGARATVAMLRQKPVQAAFIYSCVSRKWILGPDVDAEIAPIAALAPTVGFFAYGEYFTHPGGAVQFFSQTQTVLTLAEAGPEAALPLTPLPAAAAESRQLKTLRVLHRLIQTSAAEIEAANAELAQIAHKDALTGLYNRRYLDAELARALKQAQRSGRVLSLIMLDIDYFKQFNDGYGHPEGDSCLRGVALALTREVRRQTDWVVRYGGEEFVCVLPDTDLAQARALAERMRHAIAALAIEHRRSPVSEHVTASFGVLAVTQGAPAELPAVLQRVDALLYRAKAAGRNCVVGEAFGAR